MKLTSRLSLILATVTLPGRSATGCVDWFASEVVSSSNLGGFPYDYAGAVLGKPTTYFVDNGGTVWSPSMVAAAWNLAPPPYDPQDPDSGKIITTVNGDITVRFATPIEDDPENWYGLDFIVYGNSWFGGSGFVKSDTNMESYCIAWGGAGYWESSMVSVAQYYDPQKPWECDWYDYSLSTDPHADDFPPLQAFAWDNINHTWGAELDFTKPLDPALTKANFGGLSVAHAIDLYKGSAGGTAFDISRFEELPANENGRKWIQYIKVTGTGGEVDAFSRVGHAIEPVSVREAKKVADGKPVIIGEAVVTADKFDPFHLGRDYFYAQARNRSCGVKLKGLALSRGQVVTIYGVLGTDGDERAVNVTAIEQQETDEAKPVGMANRYIGGGDQIDPATGAVVQKGVKGGCGVNTIGLLLRTWGKAKSVNPTTRTWLVDDGSGCPIKCAAPPDPQFALPTENAQVAVTGVCSCERNASNEIVPVIRLRDQQDLN